MDPPSPTAAAGRVDVLIVRGMDAWTPGWMDGWVGGEMVDGGRQAFLTEDGWLVAERHISHIT